MRIRSSASKLKNSVQIPTSKSHTIRAIAAGSLAAGTSVIENPLISSDTLSAIDAYRAFGAQIEPASTITITGTSGKPMPANNVVDLQNSGTSLYIAMGTAALIDSWTILTGDDQLRSRPAKPLLDALAELGAKTQSAHGDGNPPLMIHGPMTGGAIELDGSKTSQYLTSLLFSCPFAKNDTKIVVSNLVELPYIDMTLKWLDDLSIKYTNIDYKEFHIPGRQVFKQFHKTMPGDFSSASFFLCAAAITKSTIEVKGLDLSDTQGDKGIIDILTKMGVRFSTSDDGGIYVSGGELHSGTFDLSNMPDTLPVLAATACFANGKTRLTNVAQARLKETDRISVMCKELTKLGASIKELPDGLEIEGSCLKGGAVSGHADHRVVMALAAAGLGCKESVEVDTAEAVNITFPSFVELMQKINANIELISK